MARRRRLDPSIDLPPDFGKDDINTQLGRAMERQRLEVKVVAAAREWFHATDAGRQYEYGGLLESRVRELEEFLEVKL
jgi:hypothetical protein